MAQNELKVVSWNINGLRNRTADLHYYIHKYGIDVILLQETRDGNGSLFKLNGYKQYNLPASEGARGVTTYVRNVFPSDFFVIVL